MLERSRGVRRDRSRNKKIPILRALDRNTAGTLCGKARKERERNFLRDGGSDRAAYHKCWDCGHSIGPCPLCNSETLRKQRRLHDSFDADMREWLEVEEDGTTMTEIGEIDVVEMVRDITGTPIMAGMTGTVLLVFNGGEAYYIEFVNDDGSTLYEDTFPGDAVRLFKSYAETRAEYAEKDLVAAQTRAGTKP